MANVLDVIKALHQAAADAYDGGKPLGLNREEGEPLIDNRVIDGFTIGIHGTTLKVKYQDEISMKDAGDPLFKQEIASIFRKILKYLKEEYKEEMGQNLRLKALDDEPYVCVQRLSPTHTFLVAHQCFEIGNYTLPVGEISNIISENKNKSSGEYIADGSNWSEMLKAFSNPEKRQEEGLEPDILVELYRRGK